MDWEAVGALSTAVGAAGTVGAVLVALFRPAYLRWQKNNKIEDLVEREISRNLMKIQNMRGEDVSLPPGQKISALERNRFLPEHVDLSLWRQYRYDLAEDRPDSYERYHSVNRFAEAIIEVSTEQLQHASQERRGMLLTKINSEAESFVEKCQELELEPAEDQN